MNIKKSLDFINNRVYNEYTNRDRKLSKLGKNEPLGISYKEFTKH